MKNWIKNNIKDIKIALLSAGAIMFIILGICFGLSSLISIIHYLYWYDTELCSYVITLIMSIIYITLGIFIYNKLKNKL
jgi:hypothetical protein